MVEFPLKALVVYLDCLGLFDMSDFKHRLIFQKFVYLSKVAGVENLKFHFHWYIYGPYSSELTDEGFKIAENREILKGVEVKEETFGKVIELIGKEEIRDPVWMEVLASVHFQRNIDSGKTREEILDIVRNKQPYITQHMCEKAWERLDKFQV
jgi:uncharacterized protein YwgA